MYKLFLTTIAVFATSVPALANSSYFLQETISIRDAVNERLTGCGLSFLSTLERNPTWRPQVPADYVIVSRVFGMVAAHDLEVGNGNAFVWKNPNGSYAHTVWHDGWGLRLRTPTGGTVASISRVRTSMGDQLTYRCRNRQVPERMWRECVEDQFVTLIENLLCRYGDQ